MTLFESVFAGNDAVYGLTEGAINQAIEKYGADKAVSFPDTAYFLTMLLCSNRNKGCNSCRVKRCSCSSKNSYDKREENRMTYLCQVLLQLSAQNLSKF